MIVTNGAAQTSLLASVLKGAPGAGAASAARQDPAATLMDAASQGDPDQAKALQDQKDALAKLQSAITDSRDARKAAAKEKIERLKAQIQALHMTGGDPKMVAKQAAQLARELASAAKEYAAAGGSASTASASAPSNASAPDAAAEPSAGDPANGAAPASAAAQSQTDANGDTPDQTPDGTGATVAGTSTIANDTDTDDHKAALHDRALRQMADSADKASGRAEDQDFVRKVRQLMTELKSIVEHQKTRMRQDGDVGPNRDVNQARDALRETDASLHDIAAGTVPAATYVDISI